LAQFDSQQVAGDPFTEELTPEQEVENFLETGTPFDYKGIDFTKLKDKYEQFAKDLLVDDQDVEDDGAGGLKNTTTPPGQLSAQPALIVGDTDIPVRDEKYVNQRQQRFDDAPTFEDEV